MSNGDREPTRIEKFNSLVVGFVTLSLTAGFILLAWTREIDSAVYANTYGIVITFWFVQKKAEKDAADAAAARSNGAPSLAPPTTKP